MPNQILVRGLVLAAIALAFGLGALRLPVGELAQAGAGLFPLVVSSLLLILAVIMIVQSFLVGSPPIYFNGRNIAVIMLGLGGFVALSRNLDTMAGIVWLVFVSSLAGVTYSWKRNLQVSVALILVALAFERLLGLNLRVI